MFSISISKNSFLVGSKSSIRIGENTLIADNVRIYTFDHNYHKKGTLLKNAGAIYGDVEVGNNVWIGSGVVIVRGIKIGNNLIVGAGAVVINDVAENVIVAGVPAKVIKRV